MPFLHSVRHAGGCSLAAFLLAVTAAPAQEPAPAPIAVETATVAISGTSNIHAYTASTTAVRLRHARLASGVPVGALDDMVKPGAIEAFEIVVAAATLSSPKEGLDKRMHKALKADEHPDIVFRLIRLEPGASDAMKAVGALRIAGVERQVTLDLKTERLPAALKVRGEVRLLMTDFGVKPPTAMLGMLKTDPKVTVTFETVLSSPLT